MFRLDTAEENKNEHFQLQIMNKRRTTSAEGELTNKCVAVWGNFQNRPESKLSLCKTAIPESFSFWKNDDDAGLEDENNAFSEYLTHGT